MHKERTASGWQATDELDSTNSAESSIAIDIRDYLHVVWQNNGSIKYKEYTTAWQATETLVPDTYSAYPNLIWAFWPQIGGERTNVPQDGYSFVWMDGTTIKYWSGGTDTIPPAAVTDLTISAVTSNSTTLTWTAPGDDGNVGTATEYDIRYSTSNITEANWASATQCMGEPSPKISGSVETFTNTNLSPATTYYFALKTADEVPNWSGLSNVASGTTVGIRVIQPGGGETWAIGSSQNIAWLSYGVAGNVNIYLSRDGGTSWQRVAVGTQNDGTEMLKITGPKTDQARIRVTSVSSPSIYDVSYNNFAIITRPAQTGPSVTNFTPKSGYSGDKVTIVGTNFVKGDTRILFGTILADQDDIVWNSETVIKARVPNAPETATTGRITVTTSEGTALSADKFTVMTPSQPWETQIGVYNNVPAYSSGGWYSFHYDELGNATKNTYGYSYQCVEYINRYYNQALGYKNMVGTGNADSYFWDAVGKGLSAFSNGGTMALRVDDILVFDDDGAGGKPGHVAIISSLEIDKSGQLVALSIIQQNVILTPGSKYINTARLALKVAKNKDGTLIFTVDSKGSGTGLPIIGWVRIP